MVIPGTAGCCPRRGPGRRRWTCRQPGAAGSLPSIHPLSVQPKAQVSSLRKAAVPRAIEQMGRSRARMGGPQPGSPTGRTGASRQTNWLRPTAIRWSDGFPAPAMPASETHSAPGPWTPGRAAGPASGSPGSPRSGPSRWSSWHSLGWRILRPAAAPRNWPTGFRRTRGPWGSLE